MWLKLDFPYPLVMTGQSEEDYDEGFEDEDYDWLLRVINWHLSDQVYI